MPHEVVAAFAQAGLPLCPRLRLMLDEHPDHCTERRGCGLTQATRRLAEHVNRARDPLDPADLTLFEDLVQRHVAAIAARSVASGWPHGWRRLALAPATVRAGLRGMPGVDALVDLPSRVARAWASPLGEESRLLVAMLADIVGVPLPGMPPGPPLPKLPPMPRKPETGSCSQAEEFFLEIAHGKVRRGGRVDLVLDEAGQPLLVEKIGLGESHSALLLRPAMLSGVTLPPGALLALSRDPGAWPRSVHRHGDVLPLSAVAQARFLRLTTLAVSPANRARAFGAQYRRQVQGNLVSPQSTTLDDLDAWARARLREA